MNLLYNCLGCSIGGFLKYNVRSVRFNIKSYDRNFLFTLFCDLINCYL